MRLSTALSVLSVLLWLASGFVFRVASRGPVDDFGTGILAWLLLIAAVVVTAGAFIAWVWR